MCCSIGGYSIPWRTNDGFQNGYLMVLGFFYQYFVRTKTRLLEFPSTLFFILHFFSGKSRTNKSLYIFLFSNNWTTAQLTIFLATECFESWVRAGKKERQTLRGVPFFAHATGKYILYYEIHRRRNLLIILNFLCTEEFKAFANYT